VKLLLAIITIAFGCVAPACASGSQARNMTFEAYPPSQLMRAMMGAHGWTIFASGNVDVSAHLRLKEVLEKNNVPLGSSIYLHSPGGSLGGGMALGRLIRQHRLQTRIGRRDPTSKEVSAIAGDCMSACAVAYLGGEYRFWKEGSKFGVHRFSLKDKSDNDSDIAQIIAAGLIEYIRSMDVSTDLFTVSTRAGAQEIVVPTRERLIELNVVNNGFKKPIWTIESASAGIYLKGAQETWNGVNKFLLVCPVKGSMFLHVIFDPGNNAEEVMTFDAESIQLGVTALPAGNRKAGKRLINGMINATYAIDSTVLHLLQKASKVGVLMQPTFEASFFAGFDNMPFADGAKKLEGFLSVCSR
jgi:hypothetical protein